MNSPFLVFPFLAALALAPTLGFAAGDVIDRMRKEFKPVPPPAQK